MQRCDKTKKLNHVHAAVAQKEFESLTDACDVQYSFVVTSPNDTHAFVSWRRDEESSAG